MQWIFIVLAIIFYIYRFVTKQKKEQEEAQRRRQQIPPGNPNTTTTSTSTTTTNPPANSQQQPKTIEEILQEMHRRVETQSKPYAKQVVQRPVQKPAAKKEIPKPSPKVEEKKKEPAPFLSEEYSAYKIEEAKVPANMAVDFIKQGQLTDIHNMPKEKSLLKNFNLREAVIAQIVLERREW